MSGATICYTFFSFSISYSQCIRNMRELATRGNLGEAEGGLLCETYLFPFARLCVLHNI
jgi:hypothetical protein